MHGKFKTKEDLIKSSGGLDVALTREPKPGENLVVVAGGEPGKVMAAPESETVSIDQASLLGKTVREVGSILDGLRARGISVEPKFIDQGAVLDGTKISGRLVLGASVPDKQVMLARGTTLTLVYHVPRS